MKASKLCFFIKNLVLERTPHLSLLFTAPGVLFTDDLAYILMKYEKSILRTVKIPSKIENNQVGKRWGNNPVVKTFLVRYRLALQSLVPALSITKVWPNQNPGPPILKKLIHGQV
jgi:hypothetical protein